MVKTYQESHRKKNPKNLQEKQGALGVSDCRTGGVHNKEIKKKRKKDPEPTVIGPNPRFRWIRISLDALEALD